MTINITRTTAATATAAARSRVLGPLEDLPSLVLGLLLSVVVTSPASDAIVEEIEVVSGMVVVVTMTGVVVEESIAIVEVGSRGGGIEGMGGVLSDPLVLDIENIDEVVGIPGVDDEELAVPVVNDDVGTTCSGILEFGDE